MNNQLDLRDEGVIIMVFIKTWKNAPEKVHQQLRDMSR
jgi:hypothetical protein